MVIHALFPDSILKPVGGLGEQVGQIYYRLKDKVDFRIFGFPQSEKLDGYTPVPNFMTQMYNGSFLSLTNQINYFYHSVKSKDKPDLINLQETAELLRISNQTVYNMLKAGRLSARKIGKEWRFINDEVYEVMMGKSKRTIQNQSEI